MIPAWLPLLVLAARPAVMSITDCPSARDIDSFLAVLLPDDEYQPGTATVSPSGDSLAIELRPESSVLAARRSVTVGEDCTERAKAAAVVIATWWPGTSGATRQVESLPLRHIERAYGWSLAAGGFGSFVSGSVAPGARAEVSFEHRRSRVGMRLAVTGIAAHAGTLVNGQVRWSRAGAELGPTYALRWLRVDAGFVASLLWIEGSGYDEDRQANGGALGATGGVRATAPWGHVQPWLELRAMAWPQSQNITVTESATGMRTSLPLPRAELHLGAGLTFSLF